MFLRQDTIEEENDDRGLDPVLAQFGLSFGEPERDEPLKIEAEMREEGQREEATTRAGQNCTDLVNL